MQKENVTICGITTSVLSSFVSWVRALARCERRDRCFCGYLYGDSNSMHPPGCKCQLCSQWDLADILYEKYLLERDGLL